MAEPARSGSAAKGYFVSSTSPPGGRTLCHMRRLAPLVALAVLLGAAGPAAPAAPQRHYLKLTAAFVSQLYLDYGSNPLAVYNGTYDKLVRYSVRGIVVFDGSKVSLLPGASMVASAQIYVDDSRTQFVSRDEPRKRVECKLDNFTTGGNEVFVFTNRGRVAVSNEGLTVDPGTAIKDMTCAATEELENHGLPGALALTVSPPLKSRFAGTALFTVRCSDEYSHPFTQETDGNGHAFRGDVWATVSFAPFPAANLTAVKRVLRNSVGKRPPDTDPSQRGKDCLR